MKNTGRQKILYCATYFEGFVNERIFIVGLQPPPLGGIAVHIKRKKCLLEQKGNVVFLFDVIKEYERRNKIMYVFCLFFSLFRFKPTIIYYHTLFLRKGFYEVVILILYKFFFRSKLILVEHSLRFLYKRSKNYKRFLNLLINGINQQVLIGEPMLYAYKDNGIRCKNYLIESSFIPPSLKDEAQIFDNYPQELRAFAKSKKILLVMNASKFDLWDGKDIYGFDLCLQLMNEMRLKHAGLVMAVGGIYNYDYYNYIKKKLNEENTFLALNIQAELWPLIKRADLFLRPSRFDNYSVSVAEALFFKKPVIASNVGERPKKVIVFQPGNYEDFNQKVKTWLKKHEI